MGHSRRNARVKGMVLAAGYGTRLQALGQMLPKPLLPICATPLLRYSLAQLAAAQVFDVVINTHHLAEKIQEELLEVDPKSSRDEDARREMEPFCGPYQTTCRVSLEEGKILGTGGGVLKVRDHLASDTFVLINGKIVCDLALDEVLEHHWASGCVATMVLRPDPDPYAWGACELDEDGLVRGIAAVRSTSVPESFEPASAHVFTGIHVLEPEFLEVLPQGPSCIVRAGYYEHLRRGSRISGYVHKGYWQDHSTPSRYLKGNFNLLERSEPLWPEVGFPDHVGVDPSAVIGEGVLVRDPVRIAAGAVIEPDTEIGPYAVVGPHARVRRGLKVDHAVVWADTEVTEALTSAVATPHGVVPVDLTVEGRKLGPQLRTSR